MSLRLSCLRKLIDCFDSDVAFWLSTALDQEIKQISSPAAEVQHHPITKVEQPRDRIESSALRIRSGPEQRGKFCAVLRRRTHIRIEIARRRLAGATLH